MFQEGNYSLGKKVTHFQGKNQVYLIVSEGPCCTDLLCLVFIGFLW